MVRTRHQEKQPPQIEEKDGHKVGLPAAFRVELLRHHESDFGRDHVASEFGYGEE
ncbi:MAG: hypothetical protein BWY82_01452 [Verrucomicrobia bacterium ADurb.Bin474]|nr:MAG: hypothetical protein BWY82_01452 [Verrucomicrobia bacterium ADurb.Bin474]